MSFTHTNATMSKVAFEPVPVTLSKIGRANSVFTSPASSVSMLGLKDPVSPGMAGGERGTTVGVSVRDPRPSCRQLEFAPPLKSSIPQLPGAVVPQASGCSFVYETRIVPESPVGPWGRFSQAMRSAFGPGAQRSRPQARGAGREAVHRGRGRADVGGVDPEDAGELQVDRALRRDRHVPGVAVGMDVQSVTVASASLAVA